MQKKRIFTILIAVLLVIALGVGITIAMSRNGENKETEENTKPAQTEVQPSDDESQNAESGSASESESETETLAELPVTQLDGTQDIVLFGVDTRAKNLGKGTRSDSIMIIHMDHNEKKVRISSIYRDTMLHVEGNGYKKITNAHSYGGPELSIKTLNTNLDLAIEDYVTVNFNTVGDLIDMIGGVKQDVDDEEVQVINRYIDEVNKVRGTSSSHINTAGDYTLDGTQAVAYSRIRYTSGSDYKRAERQRTILFKVFSECKNLPFTKQVKILESLMEEINTSFDHDEMLTIMSDLASYEIEGMTAFPQVFYGGSVEGHWVEVPYTLLDMNASLHEFLYGTSDYSPSSEARKISNELKKKVSGANTDIRGKY